MPTKTKFLFRGTTRNFEGGTNSKENNFTCTSTHPAIALLFAMECANRNPEDAVVYIAQIKKVQHFEVSPNVLKKVEHEFVVGIAPQEFYRYTEGYVHYRDLQEILHDFGFAMFEIVRRDKLTELCKNVKRIKAKELETLIMRIQSVIKTD